MSNPLNINGDAMEAIVAKALLDAIGTENRDKLLSDAISNLLVTPKKKDGYYAADPKSPLREMFETAASDVARRMVYDELLKDDAFKAKVRQLFMSASDKIMEGETGNQIATAMADAFVKGMKLDRY